MNNHWIDDDSISGQTPDQFMIWADPKRDHAFAYPVVLTCNWKPPIARSILSHTPALGEIYATGA